jgi:hypothetical protein
MRENNGADSEQITFCVIESCVTAAIVFNAAHISRLAVTNCTLFGSLNTTGIGISIASGALYKAVLNNIISGFVTGISSADTQTKNIDDYNDYYNNDADVSAVTQWQKGPNDVAVDPQFVNVGQVTGTAGKFAAGNDRIIDTTKDFTALGVVAGQDCVYIVSGTGATAGIYGIASITTTTNANDTLVLDIAPGTSTVADKTFQITTGHVFSIGSNLKALGSPGVFPGALTTGYLDIGAVQRREAGGLPMGMAGMVG